MDTRVTCVGFLLPEEAEDARTENPQPFFIQEKRGDADGLPGSSRLPLEPDSLFVASPACADRSAPAANRFYPHP